MRLQDETGLPGALRHVEELVRLAIGLFEARLLVEERPLAPQGGEELAFLSEGSTERTGTRVDTPHLGCAKAARGLKRDPEGEQQGQLFASALLCLGQCSNQLQRTPEVGRGFRVRGTFFGSFSRAAVVRHGGLCKTRLIEVMRQQLRGSVAPLAVALLQRVGDLAVQLSAPAPEQRLVGSVLHQSVSEQVARARWRAALHQELGVYESRESLSQRRLVEGRDRSQQVVLEVPTQDGRHLRYLLRNAEPIEARHQRVL